MNKRLTYASCILLTAMLAGSVSLWTASYAASNVQSPPKIVAPACAVRPACASNICLRNGRCTAGSTIQASGCLVYTCRITAR